MSKELQIIRDGLRRFNRWAGVLKADPYNTGLSLSQSSALVDIERFGSLKSQDLAKLLNLDKSSVSRLVAILIARNLVKVSEDSDDRRSKNLKLTGEGKKIVQKIHKQSDRSVVEALELLGEKERSEVVYAFEKLSHAVQQLDKIT